MRKISKLVLALLILLSFNNLAYATDVPNLKELSPETRQSFRDLILSGDISLHTLIRKEFPEILELSHTDQVLFELALFNALFTQTNDDPRVAAVARRFDKEIDRVMNKVIDKMRNADKPAISIGDPSSEGDEDDIENPEHNAVPVNGFNTNGINSNGFSRQRLNTQGFTRQGANRQGLSRQGYNSQGYTRQGYTSPPKDSELESTSVNMSVESPETRYGNTNDAEGGAPQR